MMMVKMKTTTSATDIPAPSQLDKLVLLIVTLRDRRQVAEAAVTKLGIDPSEVHIAIAEAFEKIRLASKWSTDEAVGEAITRLDDLYQRALQVQDVKTALAAEKEKAKVQGLYSLAKRRPAGPAIQEQTR